MNANPVTAADRIAEIKARAEAATPGPWSAANEHELLGPDADPAWCISRMQPEFEELSEIDGYMYDVAEIVKEDERDEADAQFIANAREDIPWLLQQIADRDATIARLESVHENHVIIPLDALPELHLDDRGFLTTGNLPHWNFVGHLESVTHGPDAAHSSGDEWSKALAHLAFARHYAEAERQSAAGDPR